MWRPLLHLVMLTLVSLQFSAEARVLQDQHAVSASSLSVTDDYERRSGPATERITTEADASSQEASNNFGISLRSLQAAAAQTQLAPPPPPANNEGGVVATVGPPPPPPQVVAIPQTPGQTAQVPPPPPPVNNEGGAAATVFPPPPPSQVVAGPQTPRQTAQLPPPPPPVDNEAGATCSIPRNYNIPYCKGQRQQQGRRLQQA